MKTTDLIALILYELGEGDKYGFELTKSIENLSDGKIIIKQATLYSILKKLEKSKFISSYWQDSEIGGKRHYYKLTENGNLQLSTMPGVDVIVQNILSEPDNDFVASATPQPSSHESKETLPAQENYNVKQDVKVEQVKESNNISIMDLLLESNETKTEPIPEQTSFEKTEVLESSLNEQPTPKETVLPTEEVFKDSSLDSLTESEINASNASLLHEKADDKSEKFAENENVTKFTSQPYTPIDLSNELRPQKEKFETREQIQPMKIENEEIKFVDYVNFKQNPKYIQANKLAKNMWYRLLCSSVYLVLMLVVCAVVANKTSSTIIGNISLILGIILLVFAPTIYAYNYSKFKTKCQEGKFKFDIKKRVIISVCVILAIILIVVISNIAIGKSSISNLLGIKNFSNFYAPLVVSSVVLADLLFGCLFLKKSKN